MITMHGAPFRALLLALLLASSGCELIATFNRSKIETRTTRRPGQNPLPVPPEPDGGFPQDMDASVEDGGGLDASADAASPDGSAPDAGVDAGADAATDAGADAAVDAGPDASLSDGQVPDAAADGG